MGLNSGFGSILVCPVKARRFTQDPMIVRDFRGYRVTSRLHRDQIGVSFQGVRRTTGAAVHVIHTGPILRIDMRFHIGSAYIVGPSKVLMQDPCPLGLPELLTVARANTWILHSPI